MNEIKFSVVVPAYKVEKYLPRCIDSILGQTYQNIELILVNDGSPDGCLDIMEQYAAHDGRVSVVSQANAGLSAARNAGLKIATGEYVSFIDSDDWVEPDMFAVLAMHLEKEKSDYVCFRLEFDNEERNRRHVYGKPYPQQALEGREEILRDTLKLRSIPTSAVLKVYERNFLEKNHLAFEKGIVNEDTLFSIQVACYASKVTFVNRVFYHAIEREGSISRSSQERLFVDMHTAFVKARSTMEDTGLWEELKSLYEARYLRSMLYNLLQAAQRLEYAEYRRTGKVCMERTLFKNYDRMSIRKRLPLAHRVLLLCIKSPVLFFGLIRLFNLLSFRMH